MSQSGNGINLFNGKNMDGWLARGGAPQHEWDAAGSVALNPDDSKLLVTTAGEGIFYNGATGRTVDIYTEAAYGDCELHVEFMVPQGSNSGVYLMGRYEIQILDSWGETETPLWDLWRCILPLDRQSTRRRRAAERQCQ